MLPADAISHLRAALPRFRAALSPRDVARALGALSRKWLDSDYPPRREAEERLPETTGFSPPAARVLLDNLFGELTEEALLAVRAEALGENCGAQAPSPASSARNGAAGGGARDPSPARKRGEWPRAPELIVHVLAGNVPNPGAASVALGLIAGGTNLVRPSANEPILIALYARSLVEVSPELAAAVTVVNWPSEDEAAIRAALAEAEVVVAYGKDETLAEMRKLAPKEARFVGHGSRVAAAAVGRAALVDEKQAREAAGKLARDVALTDQQGCLSPHCVYVESSTAAPGCAAAAQPPLAARTGEGACATSPRRFAALLADALKELATEIPPGKLSPERAVAIRRARTEVEFSGGEIFSPGERLGWTVAFEKSLEFRLSPLGRFVYVKPFAEMKDLTSALAPVAGMLSALGLEGLAPEDCSCPGLAPRQILPAGKMQRPPLAWRSDGKNPFEGILRPA